MLINVLIKILFINGIERESQKLPHFSNFFLQGRAFIIWILSKEDVFVLRLSSDVRSSAETLTFKKTKQNGSNYCAIGFSLDVVVSVLYGPGSLFLGHVMSHLLLSSYLLSYNRCRDIADFLRKEVFLLRKISSQAFLTSSDFNLNLAKRYSLITTYRSRLGLSPFRSPLRCVVPDIIKMGLPPPPRGF